MVYFGDKKFRAAQSGMNRSDRRKVIIPAFILIALAGLYAGMQFWQKPSKDLPRDFEVGVVGKKGSEREVSREERDANIRITEEDIPDVPPLMDVNDDPAPFEEAPGVLAVVRDDGDPNGLAEQLGMQYLFHRWRAGPEIPEEPDGFPALEKVEELSSQMRGRRYRLTVRPQMSPFPRDLGENFSGVRQYWEAWCTDGRALYRVLFIDKDPDMVLDSNTEWTVVADFLRTHQYERTDGGMARVPEMIAHRFEEPRQILDTNASWLPLVVSGAIGGIGVIFLLGLWLRQEQSRETRGGQFKMGKNRSDAT